MSTPDFEHDKIYLKIDQLTALMSQNHNAIMITLDRQSNSQSQILEQVQKTNGRVTKLEGRVTELETSLEFIKILKRNKIFFSLMFLGVVYAIENIPFKDILSNIFKFLIKI